MVWPARRRKTLRPTLHHHLHLRSLMLWNDGIMEIRFVGEDGFLGKRSAHLKENWGVFLLGRIPVFAADCSWR